MVNVAILNPTEQQRGLVRVAEGSTPSLSISNQLDLFIDYAPWTDAYLVNEFNKFLDAQADEADYYA